MSGTNALLTVTAHDGRIERSVLWDCFAKILSTGIYSSIFRILSVSVESARLMYIFCTRILLLLGCKSGPETFNRGAIGGACVQLPPRWPCSGLADDGADRHMSES